MMPEMMFRNVMQQLMLKYLLCLISLSRAAIFGWLFSRSAEVCEISPHNSDFLEFFGRMMVNLLCKWLVYFEKLLFTLF